jgi:hypothetical protein
MLSRLNYLDPTWYVRLSPQARREALRGLFATSAAVTSALYMFSRIPGVDIGSLDPRSADFGKLKIGNTRIDIAGGFQQYIRLAAELAIATGATVSSTTGKKTKLGSGYGKPTRLDLIIKFAEGKLAPAGAIATNVLRGKDPVGNPVTLESIVTSNFTPLMTQDAYDIYKENHGGVNGIEWAMAGYALGAFGFGIQTYAPKPVKARAHHHGGSGGVPGFESGGTADVPGLSGSGERTSQVCHEHRPYRGGRSRRQPLQDPARTLPQPGQPRVWLEPAGDLLSRSDRPDAADARHRRRAEGRPTRPAREPRGRRPLPALPV